MMNFERLETSPETILIEQLFKKYVVNMKIEYIYAWLFEYTKLLLLTEVMGRTTVMAISLQKSLFQLQPSV